MVEKSEDVYGYIHLHDDLMMDNKWLNLNMYNV